MKKLMIGLWLCIGANSFGMQRGIVSMARPTSLAARCFANKAELEAQAECMLFFEKMLEKRQRHLREALSTLSATATKLREADFDYELLKPLRDPKQVEKLSSRRMAVWAIYNEILDEVHSINRLLPKRIKTAEGTPIECFNPEAEARKAFKMIMAQASQKKD